MTGQHSGKEVQREATEKHNNASPSAQVLTLVTAWTEVKSNSWEDRLKGVIYFHEIEGWFGIMQFYIK